MAGLGAAPPQLAVPTPATLSGQLPLDDLRVQLAAYEGAWLEAAMTVASGNKSRAAKLLGLPRKTFENRLVKTERFGRGSVGEVGDDNV